MDTNNDIEGSLLQQLASLGTTDKEVLIAEFQKLLGNQLNPAGCAFFLDMNNWNLQAAICAYYDFDQPNVKLPELAFVSDVTIGEGEAVPPNTTFTKTWRLANPGDDAWPPGCQLKFCNGENLANTDRVIVEILLPRSSAEVSVSMHSHAQPGVYQSQWRMCTATGLFFGEPIWVIITVAEGGVLGVTQQLSRFGSDLVQNPAPQGAHNPFLSPSRMQHENAVDGAAPAFMSPNNSMIAQQGSPYITQLSPSPERTHRPEANGMLPARSLFQGVAADGATEETIDCDNCDNTSTHEEMT